MAGPATVQQSSQGFATIPNQYASAFASGWAPDQRLDAASATGGFLTNCSPTSSGKTFISTGDATPFYVVGRAAKVVQATGTAVFTVGQSSASGGITSIYINQFSTAAGLSTTLSTGAITSAAASPLVTLSTGNNTFGSVAATASTGGGFAAVAPSTLTIVGSLIVQGPYAAFGTTPGSSGVLRIPNSAIGIVGKTSTGGDDVIYPQQFSSTTLSADTQTSGVNFTALFSKTLPVGTWFIMGGATVKANNINDWATVRIDDGTNVFASAFGSSNMIQGGSTGSGATLVCSAIVSHTTALAYQFGLASNSTTLAAQALSQKTGSTGATFWTAIKIG